jgi:hypothetical protein
MRLRHQIRHGDEFHSRGDIGGFGVDSKFNWRLFGGYSHEFKICNWTITSVAGIAPCPSITPKEAAMRKKESMRSFLVLS